MTGPEGSLTIVVCKLADHCEAARSPVAHHRRAHRNPAAQNGLQEGPHKEPPPPASAQPHLISRLHERPSPPTAAQPLSCCGCQGGTAGASTERPFSDILLQVAYTRSFSLSQVHASLCSTHCWHAAGNPHKQPLSNHRVTDPYCRVPSSLTLQLSVTESLPPAYLPRAEACQSQVTMSLEPIGSRPDMPHAKVSPERQVTVC